jgi:hypothetical protein
MPREWHLPISRFRMPAPVIAFRVGEEIRSPKYELHKRFATQWRAFVKRPSEKASLFHCRRTDLFKGATVDSLPVTSQRVDRQSGIFFGYPYTLFARRTASATEAKSSD